MTRLTPSTPARVLIIAGSDSGGGAGIQADLKAFSALGVYGASVITALTAQNTVGVTGIRGVDPAFIRQQMDAVFDDIDVKAVKIGMLGTPDVIETVRGGLEAHAPRWTVLDPVMVAKSGDALLAEDAVEALAGRLLPLADVITPNLPEAARLLGTPEVADMDDMPATARALLERGPRGVLLKGGHLGGTESADFYLDRDGNDIWLPAPTWSSPLRSSPLSKTTPLCSEPRRFGAGRFRLPNALSDLVLEDPATSIKKTCGRAAQKCPGIFFPASKSMPTLGGKMVGLPIRSRTSP